MNHLVNEIVNNARKYQVSGQEIAQAFIDNHASRSHVWLARKYWENFAPHEITGALIQASKLI